MTREKVKLQNEGRQILKNKWRSHWFSLDLEVTVQDERKHGGEIVVKKQF